MPGELLIQFTSGSAGADRAAAISAIGGRALEEIQTAAGRESGQGTLMRVSIGQGLDLEKAIEILSNRPGIVHAERNWVLSTDTVSNDPAYTSGSLWGMQGDGTSPGNAFGSQAGEAWARGFVGSTKAVAGVVDTGVDYTHPDLFLNIWLNQGEIPSALKSVLMDTDADGLITFRDLNRSENGGSVSDLNGNGRIDAGDLLRDRRWEDGTDRDGNGYVDDLIGWDFVNNDNDPLDDNRHGTHVSGTIAGIGGNGIGVAGVNWQAQIMGLKFLGSGGSGSASDAIKAIDYFTWAATHTAGENFVGTNNSWGGGGYSSALFSAIDRGAAQDILFIAAAGNSARNNDFSAYYPAGYDTGANGGADVVVAVAATTSTGGLASFSSYGASTVDIGAPGASIYSTVPGGGYGTLSGTSMATPHVAGAALLYAAANPNATAAQIKAALLATAEPTASLAGRVATGGRLDIGDLMAGGTSPPPPPTGSAILAITADASAKALEGSSGSKPFSFTINRSGDTSGTSSVGWSLRHGSTDASDVTGATSGTVSFAGGETSKSVAVLVIGDTLAEADETFSVMLSNATGATIGTASAGGTIRNDDAAQPPPVSSQPTALEQYMLELVNAARLDPQAAAAKYGFTLTSYTPRQALAWNDDLGDAAQKHTTWMDANNKLSHTGEGGSTFLQRIQAEGYPTLGTWTAAENVAMRMGSGRGLDPTNVEALHKQFMQSSGHRANILSDRYEELGIGLSGDSDESWTTENFAATSLRGPFLTGVAFDDRDGDRFYDAGEGLSGVIVEVKSGTTVVATTTTLLAGGYALPVTSGSYTVVFSGGSLETPVERMATIGTRNVKIDLDADIPVASVTSTKADELFLLGYAGDWEFIENTSHHPIQPTTEGPPAAAPWKQAAVDAAHQTGVCDRLTWAGTPYDNDMLA